MKTVLVIPKSPDLFGKASPNGFPLGLAYIAAVLDKEHEVIVIDLSVEIINDEDFLLKISEFDPNVIGISVNTLSLENAKKIARLIKNQNNDIIVVIGGPHANAMPEKIMDYPFFDICVYGEGELTSKELWGCIDRGESYRDVQGIVYRDGPNIIKNCPRQLIENLDNLPYPARHLFSMDKYPLEFGSIVSRIYTIGSSRGCPFSCFFCSSNMHFGRTFRYRSAKNVADEIEMLVNEYNANGIYFREDLFTANKKRVMELCDELIKRDLGIKWICESRVDTIDDEMASQMRSAGCELIWFGAESGTQKMLDFLRKKITLSNVENAIKICKSNNIMVGANFIIGIPGETLSDIQSTIHFAEGLKADFIWINICEGWPESPLYEYIYQNKLYDMILHNWILRVRTDQFDRAQLEIIASRADKRLNRKWRIHSMINIIWQRIQAFSVSSNDVKIFCKFIKNEFK